MQQYFITAAGTGVGKTYITSLLTQLLRGQGKSVSVLKPIISGFDPEKVRESDSGILLDAAGITISENSLNAISPWRLRDPISPDMAAENEKRRIDFAELLTFCRRPQQTEYTLIEGVGGVMSPVNEKYTMLDWMAELKCRILLVSGSYLGSISHTLTAFETMQARNLTAGSIIISESVASPVPLERTLLTLRHFLPNDLPIHLLKRNERTAPLANILT